MNSSDRNHGQTRTILLVVGAFACVALVVILGDLATLPPGEKPTREGGGIETMSMLGYLTAIAVCFWAVPRAPFWPVPTLLFAMALREFDGDKRFTSEGVLSTKIIFYDTPIWEKVLALGVWALLVVALVTLVRHRLGPLIEGLRRHRPWALAFFTGLLIAAFSKTIDGLGRKLLSFGIEISSAANSNAGTLEELLELFIPVLFIIAILLRTGPKHG